MVMNTKIRISIRKKNSVGTLYIGCPHNAQKMQLFQIIVLFGQIVARVPEYFLANSCIIWTHPNNATICQKVLSIVEFYG
jgi:hypothetical protein